MKKARSLKTAGLGLVEMLIALAITAMLLTSVGMAFHASLATVDENQKISSVTHNARIVLHRLMAQARQADAIDCVTHRISIIPPDDGSGVTLAEYQLIESTLWYRQTVGGVTNSYAILGPDDGVAINDFRISSQQGLNGLGETCIINLTAVLDLQVDGNRFNVTTSTNPRRNIEW